VSATTDELACPKCGKREDLVISGLSLWPFANDRFADLKWAMQCWGDGCGKPTYHINDAARDALFGTDWRKP
jgi:hypothetical protein